MAELNKSLCKALWERYRTSEIEPDIEGEPKKWRPPDITKSERLAGFDSNPPL